MCSSMIFSTIHNLISGSLLSASQVVLVVKNLTADAGRRKRCRFDSCVGKIPWRQAWQPIPVFFPGESHGQRSLVGYSPWVRKELDTTEVTYHASTRYCPQRWWTGQRTGGKGSGFSAWWVWVHILCGFGKATPLLCDIERENST